MLLAEKVSGCLLVISVGTTRSFCSTKKVTASSDLKFRQTVYNKIKFSADNNGIFKWLILYNIPEPAWHQDISFSFKLKSFKSPSVIKTLFVHYSLVSEWAIRLRHPSKHLLRTNPIICIQSRRINDLTWAMNIHFQLLHTHTLTQFQPILHHECLSIASAKCLEIYTHNVLLSVYTLKPHTISKSLRESKEKFNSVTKRKNALEYMVLGMGHGPYPSGSGGGSNHWIILNEHTRCSRFQTPWIIKKKSIQVCECPFFPCIPIDYLRTKFPSSSLSSSLFFFCEIQNRICIYKEIKSWCRTFSMLHLTYEWMNEVCIMHTEVKVQYTII